VAAPGQLVTPAVAAELAGLAAGPGERALQSEKQVLAAEVFGAYVQVATLTK
jgi:hypothetical protein